MLNIGLTKQSTVNYKMIAEHQVSVLQLNFLRNLTEKSRTKWQKRSSLKEFTKQMPNLGPPERNLAHRVFHITGAHLVPALS